MPSSHLSNVEFYRPSRKKDCKTFKSISEATGSELCTLELPGELLGTTQGLALCPEVVMKRAGVAQAPGGSQEAGLCVLPPHLLHGPDPDSSAFISVTVTRVEAGFWELTPPPCSTSSSLSGGSGRGGGSARPCPAQGAGSEAFEGLSPAGVWPLRDIVPPSCSSDAEEGRQHSSP